MNHIKINHRHLTRDNQTPQELGQWLTLHLSMSFKPETVECEGYDIFLSPGQCIFTGKELRKLLNLSKKAFREYLNRITGSQITLEHIKDIDGEYLTTKITSIHWESIVPNQGINVFDERKRLIGYLNTQIGQNFSHTTHVAKYIDKLIREKNSPELIKTYMDIQIAQLQGTDIEHLLQPSHLFSPTKFYTWKSKHAINS